MTFIVSFLPGALDDIRRQSAWYEDKKTGLAARFERAVKEKIKLLESTPHAYKKVHGDVRRCSVQNFPYELFFKVVDERVLIIAVHGVRQDPQALKSRLEKRT